MKSLKNSDELKMTSLFWPALVLALTKKIVKMHFGCASVAANVFTRKIFYCDI